MSNEVEKMAEIINYVSCKLMDEGNSPELVAGVLAACSLSIYKSILKDDDYQAMIDEIKAMLDPKEEEKEEMSEEVAKVAYFLVSDLSTAVTGQTIYVDNGFNIVGY